MKRFGVAVLIVFAWITVVAAAGIDENKVIDLTYSFDEKIGRASCRERVYVLV